MMHHERIRAVNMSNVTRFPTKGWQRAANRRGKQSVSCVVTDRFLRFEERVHPSDEGSAITVHVRTDIHDKEHKITTLIIPLEQLHKVLKQYERTK
jgi:hypothetical protein